MSAQEIYNINLFCDSLNTKFLEDLSLNMTNNIKNIIYIL